MTTLALLTQLHDDTGLPAIAGKLFSYAAESTVAKPLYADRALSTPLSNPVVLNAAGRLPQCFMEAGLYRFVLHSAADETLAEWDNYEAVGAGLPDDILQAISALAPAAASLVGLAEEKDKVVSVADAIADTNSNLNKAAGLSSLSAANLTTLAGNIPVLKSYPKNASLGDYDALVTAATPITIHNDTFTTESGARRWTPKLSLALPFTPTGAFNPADWQEIGLVQQVSESDIALLFQHVARFNTHLPPVAPTLAPIPNIVIEEGTTGVVLDLANYASDSDSPTGNRTYTVTGLGADFSQDGSTIVASAPATAAPATITAKLTDESEQESQERSFSIEVYATGSPPTVAPKFNDIPDYEVTKGNPIAERNHKTDLLDSDSTEAQLSIVTTIDAESGATFADGLRGGTGGEVGDYAVGLTVTDQDNNTDQTSYTLSVVSAPPPVVSSIPSRQVTQSSSPLIYDLSSYVTDENTPDGEMTLTQSGGPPGTTVSGLSLSLPRSNENTSYFVTVTFTNRGGESASTQFSYSVQASGSGGGGTTPGGGGGGSSVSVLK